SRAFLLSVATSLARSAVNRFVTWFSICSRSLDTCSRSSRSAIKMAPGELRARHVQVGMHVPPDPDELPTFLKRFCEAYSANHLSKIDRIVSVAASHHRLTWIHPFLDGNSRVARLFSHALLRELGVGSELW